MQTLSRETPTQPSQLACVCLRVCVCVCFHMFVSFRALCLSHSPVSEPLSLKIQMTQ